MRNVILMEERKGSVGVGDVQVILEKVIMDYEDERKRCDDMIIDRKV